MTKPMAKRTKIGIIGCGWIADKMAITLQGTPQAEAYAIASRDINKAKSLAEQYNFQKAYGSYEELLADDNVELVYIATPHSHHYEHARMALLAGKHVLCEKAFTATTWQAEELIALAREKNLFITEAIWTRYMPLSQTINEILASGIIGTPKLLSANLCYPIGDRERLQKPELAGGALLGAIFMATDYSTSPMTPRGMIIYGVGIGLLTMIIRFWGAYPEGMSFAIFIMNAATPLINKYMRPKRFGTK